jgi:hypothetical protein
MTNSLRLLCLMLSSLALAACGGSDSGTSDTDQKTEESDPRAGYFHEAESAKLNPQLAKFNAAWTKYVQSGNACNNEAERLYAAGSSQRASVQCHLQETEAIIKGTTAVRTAVIGLDGDYREACDKQIKDFALALDKLKAAWQRVNGGWTTYASGKPAPAGLQQHSNTAGVQSRQFVDLEIPGLTKACYIASDIAQGDK